MPVNPKQEFRILAAVLLVFWLPAACCFWFDWRIAGIILTCLGTASASERCHRVATQCASVRMRVIATVMQVLIIVAAYAAYFHSYPMMNHRL